MNLANLLGLRPLDRVQLNDAVEISAMQMAPQLGYGALELPFLFFQYARPDGRLVLCSTTGHERTAAPCDVCDILPGEPMIVRAMTHDGFMSLLGRHPADARLPPDERWYAEAYVLLVQKDRCGRLDRARVRFLDDSLNTADHWHGPLHPDDRARVEARARRSEMPVIGPGRGSYTADRGSGQARQLAATTVSTFLRAALHGRRGETAQLSCAGITPLSKASLARLLDRPRPADPPHQPDLL